MSFWQSGEPLKASVCPTLLIIAECLARQIYTYTKNSFVSVSNLSWNTLVDYSLAVYCATCEGVKQKSCGHFCLCCLCMHHVWLLVHTGGRGLSGVVRGCNNSEYNTSELYQETVPLVVHLLVSTNTFCYISHQTHTDRHTHTHIDIE